MRPALLFSLALVAATGCAPAADTEGLPASIDIASDPGKTDSVGARTIVPNTISARRFLVAGESASSTRKDSVEVTSVTDTRMSVNGVFYRFTRPAGTYLHLSVKNANVFGPTDIKFALYAITSTGEVRIQGIATDPATHAQALIDGFDSIDIDDDNITFEGAKDGTSATPILGTTEWFLFAYPASTWGSLEGSYDYAITADCNGTTCK